MIGQFVVVEGPDKGKSYPLEPGKAFLIGRGQNSDTKLTDPSVSRVHCQAEIVGDQLVLSDNSTVSGTIVNGKKIDQHALRHRDTIQIGSTILRFEVKGVHEQSTVVGAGGMAPKMASETADELTALIGNALSHYEIGPVIARGQTGVVFHGKDNRDGKAVAVKVLGKEYTRIDDEVQRFIRAIKTMVGLRHPHLVELYGAGKMGDVMWIAMEYVEGESLVKVIERIGTVGMLDWRYALQVGAQIASALEAASEKQIIHRNIKPANILIRKADNAAKLGDLMLAKGLSELSAQQITKPGQMVGDLTYMSPERTGADPNAVDTRSDIYSLGATLYELLTGRPPFQGSMVELVGKIRNELPASPKKFQLSIPDVFEGAIMRMLAKAPEDRFQTPAELLRDFERVAKYNGVTLRI
jgi:serine/threonine protein kinase